VQRSLHLDRIRKIKCDESRPACSKCVSTGRACDGYGIWGGGGKALPHKSVGPRGSEGCCLSPWHFVALFSFAETSEETGYFEWFKCRTVTKLPGLFASSFWDTLLLQASSKEPAVWHAVLALGSAHKREFFNGQIKLETACPLDGHEKFILRQYSRAIGHLTQTASLDNARPTIRIALVTCVVFVCLEIILGRYQTAQSHLENGLKLLDELEANGSTVSYHPRHSVDDSIIDAFSRICSQVQLLIQPSQKPRISPPISEMEIPAPMFHSMEQARQLLYRLLSHIFYLTEQARQQCLPTSVGSSLQLVDYQCCIRAKLVSWLHTYKTSKATFLAHTPLVSGFAYDLLLICHTMTSIMAHTCLSSTDEWMYDSHTNDFVTMIMKSINIRRVFPTASRALHQHNTGKSKIVMDIGWIPPLYYIAIKCRIHRVRLQAIKLLESTGPLHREGIWDAEIVACVARKVMDIEEQDFYGDMRSADDFEFSSPPREQDFLRPVLPDSYRVHHVKVVLPDDPMGKIVLSCRQKQSNGPVRRREYEYDMFSKEWKEEA
jgi:Fungal Zn(2)-Cys(6) binuclear cluster domain/Fungal specific transcription factor domain